jgi:hypothetical protein
MLNAPDDILRELIYGLNAALLEAHPRPLSGAAVASCLQALINTTGVRLGAVALLGAWREQVEGDLDVLLREALELIMEELDDQEDPYSASDILALLQQEPFWVWRWDPYPDFEGLTPLGIEALDARGTELPLLLRPRLVAAIHQMEIDLYDLHHAQRSLYDTLDEEVFLEHIELAVDRIEGVGRAAHIAKLPERLQRGVGSVRPVGEALRLVQGWKLSPGFDPSPDDDDGEWTLRILERLYRISWAAPHR